MVDLKRILAPRRKKKSRPDGPKTIVPAAAAPPAAERFDAARERLRAQIPPRAEDD